MFAETSVCPSQTAVHLLHSALCPGKLPVDADQGPWCLLASGWTGHGEPAGQRALDGGRREPVHFALSSLSAGSPQTFGP